MNRRSNVEIARIMWGELSEIALDTLEDLTKRYSLRIASGDLLYLGGAWYITHTGLLRIAERKHCSGILITPSHQFCDPARSRWTFKATVYKHRNCKGFVGYGDADPSNVSPLVHGADMRVAAVHATETARACAEWAHLVAGTTAIREGSRFERAFRDMYTGTQHAFISEKVAMDAAQIWLGLAEDHYGL